MKELDSFQELLNIQKENNCTVEIISTVKIIPSLMETEIRHIVVFDNGTDDEFLLELSISKYLFDSFLKEDLIEYQYVGWDDEFDDYEEHNYIFGVK